MNSFDDSSFANKSWYEMCEEEAGGNNVSESNKNSEEWNRRVIVKDEVEDADVLEIWGDDSRMSPFKKGLKSPQKLAVSYAGALKKASPESEEHMPLNKSINSCDGRKSTKREIQKDFLQDDLSLTSHLDVFHMQSPCKPKSELIEPKQEVVNKLYNVWDKVNDDKEENNDNMVQDDFPKIDEWRKHSSTSKKNRSKLQELEGDLKEIRRGKRRIPLSLVDSERHPPHHKQRNKIPDEILMPSPSKIIRGFGNSENSPGSRNSDSRKRQRESYSSPSNRQRGKNTYMSPSNRQKDKHVSPAMKDHSSPLNRSLPELELETDPVIIARRQKQIDYGKNTVGYERYTSEIPRTERKKEHPKTPPRQIKYSRRAWDGLIKVWRRKLHYWDPQSEGGGNPDLLLEADDGAMSEVSSCDSYSQYSNSVPSTPQQDWKRSRKNNDSESSGDEFYEDRHRDNEECVDEEEGTGCKPLAAEEEGTGCTPLAVEEGTGCKPLVAEEEGTSCKSSTGEED